MASQKPHTDVFGRGSDPRGKEGDRPAKQRTRDCVSHRESTGGPEECCPEGVEGAWWCPFRREGEPLKAKRRVVVPCSWRGWGVVFSRENGRGAEACSCYSVDAPGKHPSGGKKPVSEDHVV